MPSHHLLKESFKYPNTDADEPRIPAVLAASLLGPNGLSATDALIPDAIQPTHAAAYGDAALRIRPIWKSTVLTAAV